MRNIRVYRDDNNRFEEASYVAVVNNQQCYLAHLEQVEVPSWKHAVIRLIRPIECPHPGLLDPDYILQHIQLGTGKVLEGNLALEGWHYLLSSEDGDIDEVLNEEMAILHEQTVRYNEIRSKIDSEKLPKDELMALLREFKDRLNWLMKSHDQQRSEISPYWQPE